jgi:FkbM family methyltransferase
MESLYNSDLFVQIGTNDGNDRFNKLVKHYKPKHVILIEPNQTLYDTIVSNYNEISNYTNITIINKCIYTKDNDIVSLFIPAKDGIYGNPGVQPERIQGNYTYNNKHFSLIPMNDWGEKKNMVEIKCSTITFKTLCNLYNISKINYLQIDTEGYDSEIISNIDLEMIDIKIIRFEKWPFDEHCFSKYHDENKHLYGLNGMKNVENILRFYNYTLQNISDEDGDDIIAFKQ